MASWRWVWLLGAWLTPTAFAASIAIDVGHHVGSPGALSARGVPEFEYNLRLAGEIAAALRAADHKVLLIGDDGLAGDLAGRAPRARGTDLLISIHHDSVQPRFLEPWQPAGGSQLYSDRFSGYSLFVSRLNPHLEASLRCASAIGAHLKRADFRASRYHADPVAGENRPFADEPNGVHYFDYLVVLRTSEVPALLFEAGVIVNRDEEMRLRDPEIRKRIVSAVIAGIERCLRADKP